MLQQQEETQSITGEGFLFPEHWDLAWAWPGQWRMRGPSDCELSVRSHPIVAGLCAGCLSPGPLTHQAQWSYLPPREWALSPPHCEAGPPHWGRDPAQSPLWSGWLAFPALSRSILETLPCVWPWTSLELEVIWILLPPTPFFVLFCFGCFLLMPTRGYCVHVYRRFWTQIWAFPPANTQVKNSKTPPHMCLQSDTWTQTHDSSHT